MLPNNLRLKKKAEFENIYKFGKFLYSKYLSVYYISNNFNYNRSAFSISKKISKKAILRNKIKRRLSSIFYNKQPKINPSFDFLFIARKGILDLDYKNLENSFERLINKFMSENNYL